MSNKKRKLKKRKKLSATDYYNIKYRALCITHADFMKFAESYAEYMSSVPKPDDKAQSAVLLGTDTRLIYDEPAPAKSVRTLIKYESNILYRLREAFLSNTPVTFDGREFLIVSLDSSTDVSFHSNKTLQIAIVMQEVSTKKS